MKRFWIRRGLRFIGFAILFVGLAGLTVMMLWNALLPTILGVSVITFWQALGLLVLSRILFGVPRGFAFGGRSWQGGRDGYGAGQHRSGRAEWKQKMTERWQNMTPDQREQLKQQWRNTCGNGWGRGRSERGSQPEQPSSDEPTDPTTTAI